MSNRAPFGIIPGSYYAFCDLCAARNFGHTMLVNYRNQFVCTDCYEDRHPQDMLMAVKENRLPPIIRRKQDTVLAASDINVYDPTTKNIYGEPL